jgi:hypothetical protein
MLHPLQRFSNSDPLARSASFVSVAGGFSVPPRSAVVFVEQQGEGPSDH